MRSQLLTLKILFLLVLLTSCRKIIYESDLGGVTKLSKISTWDTATDAEAAFYEASYDVQGKIISATGAFGDTYTIVYNAGGKITKVTRKNALRGEESVHIHFYNADGRISENRVTTLIDGDPTVYRTDHKFTYNASGKVETMEIDQNGSVTTVKYFWDGNNIAEAVTTDPFGSISVAKYKYDAKLSPGSAGGQFFEIIISGVPSSKNNVIEVETMENGSSVVKNFTYTYNASNYATSIKGSGSSGQKFYYVK